MVANSIFSCAVQFGLQPAVKGSTFKERFFPMKKLLYSAGAFALSAPLAFAEGNAPDWSAADAVVTQGKTAIETFISTNAPVIGVVVLATLVIPMIFVVRKLIARAGKQV